jgi:hypothetical protein
MSDVKGCIGCRHHHKSERRKALEVADGDMELVAYDEEPLVWLVCMHASQPHKEIGTVDSDPAPGQDCELFEGPRASRMSPELERLLARRESR